MRFFVLIAGVTKGPLTIDEILDMESLGAINDQTNICVEGSESWTFFSSVRTMINSEHNDAFLMSGSESEKVIPSSEIDIPCEIRTKSNMENNHKGRCCVNSSQIPTIFRGVGNVCFVLGVVIPALLLLGKNDQPILAAASCIVLLLTGLGWIGVAHIIRLLEKIAEPGR